MSEIGKPAIFKIYWKGTEKPEEVWVDKWVPEGNWMAYWPMSGPFTIIPASSVKKIEVSDRKIGLEPPPKNPKGIVH